MTIRRSPDLPSVAVILVTHCSARIVGQALDSIRALDYPPACVQVVVVDNASHDQTVPLIRQGFPEVQVMAARRNHGFAGANTLAMQRHPADYFALINPDVVLRPDWLRHAVAAMQADESIGVVGSKIFYRNRVLLQHTGGGLRDNLLTYHLGDGELDIGQYEVQRDIEYAMGAALLTRGSTAAALNYLPMAYFMYYEEVEYCARARWGGWRVVYVPTAVAYHDERHSLGGAREQRTARHLRYLRRYHQSRYLFALRTLHTAADRQRFAGAERDWLRRMGSALRLRVFLGRCKLAHWRLLLRPEHRWLLAV
jgi:hypothetical protein